MKRQTERDYSATRMKRSRAYSPDRHFESGKYYSRRGQDTSPSRYDYFDKDTHSEKPGYKRPFTTLCISGFSSRIPEHVIKEDLYNEFKCFGDLTIKFVTFKGEKMCYITFVHGQDAADALDQKGDLKLYDRQLLVESVDSETSSVDRRDNSPGGSYRNQTAYDKARDGASQEGVTSRSRDRGKYGSYLEKRPHRCLYVNNVSPDLTESEMRSHFDEYGCIEKVSIKQTKATSAFGFVKFVNADMAQRAKSRMDGKYIRKFQCQIAYAKLTPTRCLWIGGLGAWVCVDKLQREFSRWGSVDKIEFQKHKDYAYVLYKALDEASMAYEKMHRFSLDGSDKLIRVDYADENHVYIDPNSARHDRDRKSGSRSRSELRKGVKSSRDLSLSTLTTFTELPRCCSEVWRGFLGIKVNAFLCKMYHIGGEKLLIDQFLHRVELLRITKRMELDSEKLGEILNGLLDADGGWCCMVALPALSRPSLSGAKSTTVVPAGSERPLRHLMGYLRAKSAAGICALTPGESGSAYGCLMYAFPPCEFAYKLASERCSDLSSSYYRDDHVVVVLIRTHSTAT